MPEIVPFARGREVGERTSGGDTREGRPTDGASGSLLTGARRRPVFEKRALVSARLLREGEGGGEPDAQPSARGYHNPLGGLKIFTTTDTTALPVYHATTDRGKDGPGKRGRNGKREPHADRVDGRGPSLRACAVDRSTGRGGGAMRRLDGGVGRAHPLTARRQCPRVRRGDVVGAGVVPGVLVLAR